MKELLNHFEDLNLQVNELNTEKEGKEYDAAQFKLDGRKVLYRKAKQTPKKIGQFVTCWKRDKKGITSPFHENDPIDFYFISVEKVNQKGVFIFPKSELIQNGIISTSNKDGKRGFRVYPTWDKPTNKQANKTQKWQVKFFVDFSEIEQFMELLKN